MARNDGVVRLTEPRKMKQVKGDKKKLMKLKELKKVNKEIDKVHTADHKRFDKVDKMFTKRRKLQEELGIS